MLVVRAYTLLWWTRTHRSFLLACGAWTDDGRWRWYGTTCLGTWVDLCGGTTCVYVRTKKYVSKGVYCRSLCSNPRCWLHRAYKSTRKGTSLNRQTLRIASQGSAGRRQKRLRTSRFRIPLMACWSLISCCFKLDAARGNLKIAHTKRQHYQGKLYSYACRMQR